MKKTAIFIIGCLILATVLVPHNIATNVTSNARRAIKSFNQTFSNVWPPAGPPEAPGADEVTGLHGDWDKLLKKYIQNGGVDYKAFASDVKVLDAYLEKLSNQDISPYTRQQKLAFWINAYNAFTIKLILSHYPIKSIRKISRPWKQRIWKVAGQTLSLDDIEHDILRKQLKEPRIHFAVVCASIGCPDLQRFAYDAHRLDAQLDQAARQFFLTPKHFQPQTEGDTVIIYINKFFSWFGEDFGSTKEEKIRFITPYLPASTVALLKNAASVKIKYLPYDWALNEKK